MKRRRQRVLLITVALALFVFSVNWSSAVLTTRASGGDAQKATDASALFKKNCATCHGQDGRAKTFKAKFNHARDLSNAAWQREVTDERLFNSITRGRGKMPAFGKKLTESEINLLVQFVRQFGR